GQAGLGRLRDAEVDLQITAALAVVGVVTAKVRGLDEEHVGVDERARGRVDVHDAALVGSDAVRLDALDRLATLDHLLPQDAALRVGARLPGRADVDGADPGAVGLPLLRVGRPRSDRR